MTIYTNCTDVTISDMARLTFYDINNSERIEVISLAMRIEHLQNLAETIRETLYRYNNN